MFIILIVFINTYVKTHQIVHLKYIPFNIGQFCHNKAVEHKIKKNQPLKETIKQILELVCTTGA